MSITQYTLTWDYYKTDVCKGFTNLQQNEEFVDMTLAADGHLVKVHKSILALASPYIKSMLQSTPNEHPVVFLASVSYEILNYILTYAYTGEVSVEVDKMQSFMKVAKDLQLCGLFAMPALKVCSRQNMENIHEDVQEQSYSEKPILDTEKSDNERVTDNEILSSSVAEPATANIEQMDKTVSAVRLTESNVSAKHPRNMCLSYMKSNNESDFTCIDGKLNNSESGLYETADGYQYKLEIQQAYHKLPDCSIPAKVENNSNEPSLQEPSNGNASGVSSNFNDNCDTQSNTSNKEIFTAPWPLVGTLDPKDFTPQYTMSSRGSLQLILNRFMYYCHHQSHGGRKRRWRCIDYRKNHCPAFIDTDNGIMTIRKFGHAHSFHDEKIRKKMNKDLVYTNLKCLLLKINEKKLNNQ